MRPVREVPFHKRHLALRILFSLMRLEYTTNHGLRGRSLGLARSILAIYSLIGCFFFTVSSFSAEPAGYFYAYASNDQSHNQPTRVSNVFFTSLGWSDRQRRVRSILNNFQGWMGVNGPFHAREDAETDRARIFTGLREFAVPDPLN
jgi:hypothetical protein